MLTKSCFLFFSKTSKIKKRGGGGKLGVNMLIKAGRRRGGGAFIRLFGTLEYMACGEAG